MSHYVRRSDARFARHRELLNQDKWWRSNDGRVERLSQMDRGHRLNLIAYLERNALNIAEAEYRELSGYGVELPDDVEATLDERMRNPEKWIRSTPLYKRLVALTLRDLAPELGETELNYAVWYFTRRKR